MKDYEEKIYNQYIIYSNQKYLIYYNINNLI